MTEGLFNVGGSDPGIPQPEADDVASGDTLYSPWIALNCAAHLSARARTTGDPFSPATDLAWEFSDDQSVIYPEAVINDIGWSTSQIWNKPQLDLGMLHFDSGAWTLDTPITVAAGYVIQTTVVTAATVLTLNQGFDYYYGTSSGLPYPQSQFTPTRAPGGGPPRQLTNYATDGAISFDYTLPLVDQATQIMRDAWLDNSGPARHLPFRYCRAKLTAAKDQTDVWIEITNTRESPWRSVNFEGRIFDDSVPVGATRVADWIDCDRAVSIDFMVGPCASGWNVAEVHIEVADTTDDPEPFRTQDNNLHNWTLPMASQVGRPMMACLSSNSGPRRFPRRYMRPVFLGGGDETSAFTLDAWTLRED